MAAEYGTFQESYARLLLGYLPDNWRYARIGDLEEEGVITDIQDGNHGEKHPKSSDYVPSGVPFIMAKDLVRNRLDLANCNFIHREQAESLRIGFAKPGDVLLSHKATMGRVAIVPEGFDYVMLTPQVTYYRVGDSTRLENRFLHYAFLSPQFQNQLISSSDQSTRKYIGITAQRDLWIPLPPLTEQKAITHILGTLDDKIELNRRVNETLEAMARTIFQDWFVDFGPTRAKMEGRAPYLASDIWSLFPSSLDDDDKPDGWGLRSVYSIAEFVNGAAYRDMHFSPERDGLPVIKIAELKSGVTSNTKFTTTNLGEKYRIRMGEILFSWSGNPDTSIDTFLWDGGSAWLNQHIFCVRENGSATREMIYFQLKHLNPVFAEIARNKQTTGLGHVTVTDMKALLVCKPQEQVARAFAETVNPMFRGIMGNLLENRTIVQLRDLLIPKLMSGQIRLHDVEKFVEQVA